VSDSFQRTLDNFFGYLPNIVAFLVILLIGYIVARIVKAIVAKGLQKLGLDRQLQESQAGAYVERALPDASPSRAIASVVFWIVFIFFLFSGLGALRVPALTDFMNGVLNYLPNVVVAILIFVAAAALAGMAATAIMRLMGQTPTGKIAGAVVPAIIMVIAMFMILEQLNIAAQIVEIAFAATMGALALGLALAFGLGGRPIAQEMLQEAYDSSRRSRSQPAGGHSASNGASADSVSAASGHVSSATAEYESPRAEPR